MEVSYGIILILVLGQRILREGWLLMLREMCILRGNLILVETLVGLLSNLMKMMDLKYGMTLLAEEMQSFEL